MVSITNFEKTIESKIVKRGREYYEDDLVDDLEETEKDHFTATVLGSDDYKVEIILSEDNIHEHFCDCPYDYGEFCKHEVAVLFSILDQYKVDETEDVEQKVKESKSSEKIDLADILETVSHKELKEFLLSYAGSDIHFKNTLIRNFAETSGNTMSFQAYQTQIKDIYKSGKDRYGFIEWRLMKKVGKQLIAFLSEIQKNLDNSNQAAAFYMSSALLEESVGMAGFCDDSDGYLTEINSIVRETLRQRKPTQSSKETNHQFYVKPKLIQLTFYDGCRLSISNTSDTTKPKAANQESETGKYPETKFPQVILICFDQNLIS